MVTGDIHNIAHEVQQFDSNYRLKLNEALGAYQVVELRPWMRNEGSYNGSPLFSCQEVEEVVMTCDFIDAEKEAPDMRIIYALRDKDIWRYPGGPKAYYEDMMRETERNNEIKAQKRQEEEAYMWGERHKHIVREHDGFDSQTIF